MPLVRITKATFANMDVYRRADLGMINLENPLTRATIPLPDKKFNFKANPDSVKVLTSGGVSLVNLANNHAMDYQEPGLLETLETLNKAGIEHVGAGRDVKEARRPEIIDVKGQRVAYFGYYGADFESAGETKAGTNYADEQRIAEDIKAVRNQVDWVIVNYHWGEELATHPADWQINLAHFTIDQGADVVVGHHPHVLQGAEIYKGRPIAYSMGNFIFGGNPRSDYDTAVLKIALKDKQMKVEFVPVEVRGYKPQVASDRSAQILNQIADLSSEFQQPMRSPVALDIRPGMPVNAAVATPFTPTTAPSPTVQSPTVDETAVPKLATPTEPAAEPPVQPANSTESSQPVAPSAAPSNANAPELTAPEANPSARAIDQLTPFQKKAHSGFAKPSASFITSPNRDSLDSAQSAPDKAQEAQPPSDSMVPTAEPVQPDASATPDHSALPSDRWLSAVPSAQRQIPTHQPVATRVASDSSARSQDNPKKTQAPRSKPSKHQRSRQVTSDWVASEHVGAELIPDVSLLAAMAW